MLLLRNETPTFLQMRPSHLALLISLTFVAFAPVIAAQQCQPNLEASALDEPYRGYAPTGYKGAMERDSSWFRLVRPVRLADGSERYAVRRQPKGTRQLYESIVPIHLGGHHVGLVASRQGCAELLDANGANYDVARFEEVETDWEYGDSAQKSVRLKFIFNGESGSEFSYAIFTNGRKTAESPSHYKVAQPWDTDLYYIQSADSGHSGVLEMKGLKEVLKPEWEKVDLLYDYHRYHHLQEAEHAFLVAIKDGAHLFNLTGTPISLARFDSIEYVHSFFFVRPSEPGPAIVVAKDSLTKTCRLYNASLQPLLDKAVPTDRFGTCSMRDWLLKSHNRFAFTDTHGLTQIYEKGLSGNAGKLTQIAANIRGSIVHVQPDGSMVLKSTYDGDIAYRLVDPDGTDVPNMTFEAVGDACHLIHVKKNGQWWSIGRDKLIPPIYPFSC